MNFLIVGPGAMGCLFAAKLMKAGHEVTLLDYREERAALINKNGIHVQGVSGEYDVWVPVITQRPTPSPDVVIMCVKAHRTRQAGTTIAPWMGPDTNILTLQNGLGNMEILEEIFGEEMVLGGVTAQGATLIGPGKVRHAGQGETLIGPSDRLEDRVKEIVSSFDSAGLETRAVDKVTDLIWGKLVINVGINALTALTRLKNGQLPQTEGTKTVMKQAVNEAVAVAHAKGIHLPYTDPLARVIEVCRATSDNVASMLQDTLNKRITEVEFINGAIVREAQSLDIPSPVNNILTCLVQAIQERYEQQVEEI